MHFNNLDTTLGPGYIYLNDDYFTDTLPEISFPDGAIPEYVNSFSLLDPASAECSFETEINADAFNKYFGVDCSGAQSFSAIFSEPYQEQRRKHKKKRINKKWAKRYGYVTKFRKWRINEISLMSNGGWEFEATGRNIELITR